MIVRWRRLFHCTRYLVFRNLRNPSLKSPENSSQLNLCPAVVQTTVSNCPSDIVALSFFLWCARQPKYFHDPGSFDKIIPVVCRLTERFGSVAGIVEELESIGCHTKAQTLMILLRVYWRGTSYGLALEAFEEMAIRNYVPNTFARNIILDVLFKIGHFDAAMKFLRDIQSPNFLSFNTAICNLSKAGDWLRVRDVLREMVKKGFCPNMGTYSVILDCFSKAGRLMELLQLLAFMIVCGGRLTVVIWTILIDSLCRAGKVDMAGELLKKMIDFGCSPSVVTYTSVIKGFFEAQMHNKVFRVLNDMLSNRCDPDLVLYNVLMNCLSMEGRYSDAIDLFLSLQKRNLKPDSYTLSSLVSVLCSSGKMGLFPKLVTGLDVCIDLVACNSLLNIFCKAGFPFQAIEVYSDMVDRGFVPDSYTYVGLLNALCMSGRIDFAINVYHSIVVNNRRIDGYVHAAILDGLVKRGKHHRAIKLFRRAVSENYCLDVVSYTIAIHALFRGGRFEEACSLFDQMKQSGLIPNICTYNVMLRGLCRARDINAVKMLVRDMSVTGVDMDCVSFNTIIRLLIKLRRINSAFLVYKKMCDLKMKPSSTTYSMLFDGLVHACAGEDLYPQLISYLKESSFFDSIGSDSSDELLSCCGNS